MNVALWRDLKRRLNGWTIISVIGAALALIPSLYIWLGLFSKPNENWQHIKEYVLIRSTLETLSLVLGAGFFTIVIGVSLAWLAAAYDFPLRRFFQFAFVMPLAIPPYIAAYTYGDMLSYTGSIQVFMRNVLGMTPNQAYFDIMSLKGAIFIFSLFLFPYVYLITKSFMEKQSAAYIENARLLGKGPLHIFFRIVLPLSKPAIVGGVSLVAFEVLNDYGVTKHFGISSFTTAIFNTWFGMYDVESAIRLSGLLMSLVIGLFIIERLLRRRRSYHSSTSKHAPLHRRRLRGIPAFAAVAISGFICVLSFVIPVLQLVVWAIWTYEDVLNAKFLSMLSNTLIVAFLAIILLMFLAVDCS